MSRKRRNKNINKWGSSLQRCGPKGAAQVVDGIYISGEHFAKDKSRLFSIGVGSIVACGCQAHHPEHFQYMEIHLKDSATSNLSHHLDPAADFIARSWSRGAVLVHCKAGICRSATMIAAYRRDLALTVDDAMMVLRKSRPCANPRPEFMKALNKFSEHVAWLQERKQQRQTKERKDVNGIDEVNENGIDENV